MTGPSPEQAARLRALKATTESDGASLPVTDAEGGVIGRLRPVTESLAEARGTAELLCRWRAAAPEGFLTVFQPSVEKTRGYLRNLALADPARILFLIEDADGRPVGNIGLCNVVPGEAEVDNVVRGEPVSQPGFMGDVQEALIGWAARELGVSRVYLNVIAGNGRAVASYRRAGYAETGRVPLSREDTADGYRLVPAGPESTADETLVRMERDAVIGPT